MCQRRKETKKYKYFQNVSMRYCTSSENLICCCFLQSGLSVFFFFQQRWTLDLSYNVYSQNQKSRGGVVFCKIIDWPMCERCYFSVSWFIVSEETVSIDIIYLLCRHFIFAAMFVRVWEIKKIITPKKQISLRIR